MHKFIYIILIVLLTSCDPSSNTITGEVVNVADGDTFTMKTITNEKIKIRLYGIDAPERGQDFGTKSRQLLNDLCYGKIVEVTVEDIDQYDRTLGTVYVDDVNVNEEMVRNGLAWYYSHFVDNPRLDSLEQVARSEKLNIWSQKNPKSPFEFRQQKKKKE